MPDSVTESIASVRSDPFPYPLKQRDTKPNDSLLVDWIRNHSSYLTVGDLASKLGRAGTFVGGTIGNWFILLPWLLGIAYTIGYFHFHVLDYPLRCWTIVTVVLTIPIVVMFMVRGQRSQQLSTPDGERRWNMTKVQTRFLGCVILAGTVAVVVIGVPFLVELIRDVTRFWRTNTLTIAGTLGAMLAVVGTVQNSVSHRFAWVLFGLKMLASVIALTSLVAVLLWLENFVVYGNVFWLRRWWIFGKYPMLDLLDPMVALIAVLAVFFVIVCGWTILNRWRIFLPFRQGVLDWTLRWPIICIVVGLGLWPAAFTWIGPGEWKHWRETDKYLSNMRAGIGSLTRPISSIAKAGIGMEPISSDDQDPIRFANQKASVLPEQSNRVLVKLQTQQKSLSELYNLQPHGLENKSEAVQNVDPWSVAYFDEAQRFVDLGAELGELDQMTIARIRSAATESNRRNLVSAMHSRKKLEPSGMNGLLRAAVAIETLRQMHMAEIRSGTEPDMEKNSGNLWTGRPSEEQVGAWLEKLQQTYLSTRHQHEFATLVGRDDELSPHDQPGAGTIANRGTITILSRDLSTPERDELKQSVRSSAILYYLEQFDLATLADISDSSAEKSLIEEAILNKHLTVLCDKELSEIASLLVLAELGKTPANDELHIFLPEGLNAFAARRSFPKANEREVAKRLGEQALAVLIRRCLDERGEARLSAPAVRDFDCSSTDQRKNRRARTGKEFGRFGFVFK